MLFALTFICISFFYSDFFLCCFSVCGYGIYICIDWRSKFKKMDLKRF